MDQTESLAGALKLLGGASAVARLRGIKTPWGVSKWLKDGLPDAHVLWLAEQTAWRFTPHQLAPHLYPHPDDGLPERFRGGRLAAVDSRPAAA